MKDKSCRERKKKKRPKNTASTSNSPKEVAGTWGKLCLIFGLATIARRMIFNAVFITSLPFEVVMSPSSSRISDGSLKNFFPPSTPGDRLTKTPNWEIRELRSCSVCFKRLYLIQYGEGKIPSTF